MRMTVWPSARRGLALLAAAALLAACTTPAPVPTPTGGVQFTGCDHVACDGNLAGAPYAIVMPTTWNGTLLLYSHGYRPAQPVPPDFAPVSTTAEPAPFWNDDPDGLGQTLLKEGYALAGSAYATNGWAVSDGVAAGEQLHAYFATHVGTPQRTYVWGESLGGLVTETLAEAHPDWVSGAAPFCGVLAGVVPNFDVGLDMAYAVKALLAPRLRLVGYPSYQDAVENLQSASQAVLAAAKDPTGPGGATLLAIAGIAGAAHRTEKYDGQTPTSRVDAAAEAIVVGLGFGTAARYDVEQRFGGNISGNVGVDYAGRLSPADARLVESVAPGTTARVLAALAAGARVTADAAAVAKADALGGDPQGTVAVPTITVHTAADPLVIVQNESFFAARYARQRAAGVAKGGLAQIYTVAPATYPESGAPYGAGHCTFTPGTATGVIALLDRWVRGGTAPTPAAITVALGPDSGYDAGFRPGPWPRIGS